MHVSRRASIEKMNKPLEENWTRRSELRRTLRTSSIANPKRMTIIQDNSREAFYRKQSMQNGIYGTE